MKKTALLVVIFCLFSLGFVSGSSAEGDLPVSMLETMKNNVTELRVFLMPAVFVISGSEVDGMKHGDYPWLEERCIEWYSVPVVNREYDATIRIPVGSYKLFFIALGGEEWRPAIFYSAPEEVFIIRDGEILSPEIMMVALGYPIQVDVGNMSDYFDNNDIAGKIQYLLDGDIWIEDVNLHISDSVYGTWVFFPYGNVTDMKLLVNTNTQMLTAPISWDATIDGAVVVDLQPQMSGGILSPVITWPEDPTDDN
ncbi:MAG: hypothetical protein WA019_02145 [Candidatus Moraniibacteriota bacterium]